MCATPVGMFLRATRFEPRFFVWVVVVAAIRLLLSILTVSELAVSGQVGRFGFTYTGFTYTGFTY